MKCTCTSAVDHLGRKLPSPILAKTVGAIFRRERIVVDPNVLGSRLLIVPDRNQIVLAAGRLLFACAFTISNPGSELLRSQVILEPLEKFPLHPFDCRSQMIRIIASRRTGWTIHEAAGQLFRSLPPVLHHDDDGASLLLRNRRLRRCRPAVHTFTQ